MAKISTKPPSGMRDFLPEDLARRQHVVSVIRETYQSYGFVPLETPSIENLKILTGNYGEDEKLIYRVLHRGASLERVLAEADPITADALSDQALRYDLTVPLARVVAQYADLPRYFKRYQIQPVWRADRPGKGRFREFYQCDVDITGTTNLMAEAEVCAAGCQVLSRLGFENYTFGINHRKLLRGLIRTSGIDTALEGSALVAVDKLDKVGREGVLAELVGRGIASDSGTRLLELIDRDDDNATTIGRLREDLKDEEGLSALDELAELVELLAATPAGARARIRPQLARGLGYYTGAIFEVTVDDLAGSIAGGGRYDELVGVFGKRSVPAVGLSLGLERILVVMEQRGMYPELRSGPDVMLCWRGVDRVAVLKIAHAIRAQGVRVEVFPEPAKLGKQIQYADAAGVKARYTAIVGEKELAAQSVTLKHLASGEQTEVPLAEVGARVKANAS